MCGRYNVTDSAEVRGLCDFLGIKLYPEPRRNIAPGAQGQFVIETAGQRQLTTGIWSALIEAKPDGSGYRPNPKFKTFNARYDRLVSSPLWKRLYFSQRAIIPASGWHEWLGKQCYQLTPHNAAIAFGGIYQLYRFGDELLPAYAIITLPPHPRIRHIHEKSLPLMLQPEDFAAWLDPDWQQVEAFAPLLVPKLRHDLIATPIDNPNTMLPSGPSECIPADEQASL